MQLQYVSGAGRGCDWNYFELLSADGKELARNTKSGLVSELQGLGESGFTGRSCGAVRNRLIEYDGKIYFESNVGGATTASHAVLALERGAVTTICSFGRTAESSVLSLR